MTKENIENLVVLQTEFQNTCKNVCKHLVSLDNDFKYCYKFEIDTVSGQIECRGYYIVMGESQAQDVYKAFPIEFLTYTNKQLDEYVIKKFEEQSDMTTLRELADKYGYEIIKL